MSPAKQRPPDDDDSDDDIDVVRFRIPLFGSFEGKGDWIDRHGALLIKTFGVVVVTGFIAFAVVRIWKP